MKVIKDNIDTLTCPVCEGRRLGFIDRTWDGVEFTIEWQCECGTRFVQTYELSQVEIIDE